jgi:hypothetical protein
VEAEGIPKIHGTSFSGLVHVRFVVLLRKSGSKRWDDSAADVNNGGDGAEKRVTW